MSRTFPIVLFVLTVGPAPALAAQRVTHTDGVVFVDRDGVHAQSGRAELILPDGAIVHLDVDSDVQVDQAERLIVRRGRVAIRTPAIAPWTRIALPTATAALAPGGAYSVMFDPVRQHLLVTVSAGRAELESPRGGAILVGGQRAVMFNGSGAPVPTTFTPTPGDRFAQWSEARLQHAAAATIPGPRDPHPGVASPAAPAGAYGDTGAGIYVGPGIYTSPGYGYGCGYAPCGGAYGDGGYGDRRGHRSRDPYAPDFKPRFSAPRGDSSPARFGPRGLEAPVIPAPPPPRRHASPRPELPPRVAPPPKEQPPPPSPKVNGASSGMRVNRPGAAAARPAPPPSPGGPVNVGIEPR